VIEVEEGPRERDERRLRRAAVTRAMRRPPEPDAGAADAGAADAGAADAGAADAGAADAGTARARTAEESDAARAARRLEHQAQWVELQVRQAMARGDFDNLPGAGKPLRLPPGHDPDWWVRGLIEREHITGVLPPALGLRVEDAGLNAALDHEPTEAAVRRAVEDFNRRVRDARRQLLGGPPVITPTRDVEHEVAAWRERRAERIRRARARAPEQAPERAEPGWWRRLGRH
jgi:hypothetical protein